MSLPEIPRPEKPLGFPAPKTETEMMDRFSCEYSGQIIRHAKDRLPENPLTENQLFQLIMIYYGVFFYDFVCGGHLLSGETTGNERAHSYRRSYLLPDQPTDPDSIKRNILYWPVNLIKENRTNSPAAKINGFIEIPAAYLKKTSPKINSVYNYRFFSSDLLNIIRWTLFPSGGHDVYTSQAYLEYGVLAGIEEAQHTHFWYLENKNFKNDTDNINYVEGPLKSYILKSQTFTGIGLDGNLNYHGGIGAEFAAFVTTSMYVKNYQPTLWNTGRQQYYEAVKKHRRRLATSKEAIIRPK